jgi:hypothetical protein
MSILSFILRRKPRAILPPFNFALNTYHPRTIWPPDFNSLSAKESFRFERKFRKRAKLKWARPLWNKSLVLIQWFAISSVLVYAVLYLDYSGGIEGRENQRDPGPLKSIRDWWFGLGDRVFGNGGRKGEIESMRGKLQDEEDRLLRARDERLKAEMGNAR